MGVAGDTVSVVVSGAVAAPMNHYGRPKSRSIALCVVGAIHGLGLWALSTATETQQAPAELRIITMAEILTNNPEKVTTTRPSLMHNIEVLQDPAEPAIGLPLAPTIRFADANPGAVTTAPQPLDSELPDMRPYAQLAGLRPGESAVVVLRVEVLLSGQVGQVEVDVSSGSRQVDEAAMAYARLLAWVPGRFDGTGKTTWVRQGIRLAA